MPSSVEELTALLDLESIDLNLFRGVQPETSLQRVFGGQVMAQALLAADRTTDAEFVVHSMHSFFLLPGDTAVPIVYDVSRLKDGRSFQTRHVVARQHGRPIFHMTANFQLPEDGLEHADPMPPNVVPPEESLDLARLYGGGRDDAVGAWEREWSALEVRYAGNSRLSEHLAGGERSVRAQLWIRINGALPEDPLMQRAGFTYASDLTLLGAALVPHDLLIGQPGMQAATLDHTIWFHRPFRADDWWLFDQSSPSASGGRGLSTARVFTRDGRLVATVAQEGVIRYRPPAT